jgi:hypothetical protein
MDGIGSLGAFVVGLAAFALATPALVLAFGERPPASRMPRSVIAVAAATSLAFVGAAVGAAIYEAGLAVLGLMLAAAELAGSAAIWLGRGRTHDEDHGDDHGGWWDRGWDRPEGPRGGDLPDEYWQRWEEQLNSPAVALSDGDDVSIR